MFDYICDIIELQVIRRILLHWSSIRMLSHLKNRWLRRNTN